MLSPSNLINGLIKIFNNMKLVVHNAAPLLLTQGGFKQLLGCFLCPTSDQIENPRATDVSQNTRVTVPFLNTVLIKPQALHRNLRSSSQTTFNRFFNDRVYRFPRQVSQRARRLNVGTRLQQLDIKGLHQHSHASIAISPRNGKFFERSVAVFQLRQCRFDNGFKLKSIQVTPLPLTPSIDMGLCSRLGWISPNDAFIQGNLNNKLIDPFQEGNILDIPRIGNIQHIFIMFIRTQFSPPNSWLDRPYFSSFSDPSYPQRLCVRQKRRQPLWITPKSKNSRISHS